MIDTVNSTVSRNGTEPPIGLGPDGERSLVLSVVIPAHNEAESVPDTVSALVVTLRDAGIPYEIVVVDDGSTDGTAAAMAPLSAADPAVRCIRSHLPPGFGHAVRAGLDRYTGDAVAIFMADQSDDPADLVTYYRVLTAGFDCAFGSRFVRGGSVHHYPWAKLLINRLVNFGIRVLFRHGYNDTTNAFKAYRREVIDGLSPLVSNHFNLTVELPLKAIVRGHSYDVVPISWRNRQHGASKLRLQEMGSRYMFIVFYVFLEHHLSRGDYRRPGLQSRRGRLRAGLHYADLEATRAPRARKDMLVEAR
jgi:dolichol-phosphate mannosyltransferase